MHMTPQPPTSLATLACGLQAQPASRALAALNPKVWPCRSSALDRLNPAGLEGLEPQARRDARLLPRHQPRLS